MPRDEIAQQRRGERWWPEAECLLSFVECAATRAIGRDTIEQYSHSTNMSRRMLLLLRAFGPMFLFGCSRASTLESVCSLSLKRDGPFVG